MKWERFRQIDDFEDRRGLPPPTQREIDRAIGLGLLRQYFLDRRFQGPRAHGFCRCAALELLQNEQA
jgi:hypothetical protein